MGTEHTTRQANRVADVSDSLDAMNDSEARAAWRDAQALYLHGAVSFLEAFEQVVKGRDNDDK